MKTVLLKKSFDIAVSESIEVLSKGGVILYPTDTLYGLGALGTTQPALKRIYKIKDREEKKPLSVMVAKPSLEKYIQLDPDTKYYIETLLPGPYTLLCKPKSILKHISEEKIGIRIPDNNFCLTLLNNFDLITSTSANLSGESPPWAPKQIKPEILNQVDLFINGGPCRYKQPSTIIDLVDKKVIRLGAVAKQHQDIITHFTD